MSELAGRQALDELILTQLLDQHAQQAGWIVDENDIQSELGALIATLNQSTPSESSARLIESIRERRGLGPTRFNTLLRRNAILRRMIIESPEIPALVEQETQAAIERSNESIPEARMIQIRERATLVAQQTLMERKARDLVSNAEVLIMDPSINWAGE